MWYLSEGTCKCFLIGVCIRTGSGICLTEEVIPDTWIRYPTVIEHGFHQPVGLVDIGPGRCVIQCIIRVPAVRLQFPVPVLQEKVIA